MGEKIIAINRKAKHEYFLEEFFEAGIVLTGTEIKSVRMGKIQFKDSYISIVDNEAFIKEMHIAQYNLGGVFNHDETRIRKLLLHKKEIKKLSQDVKLQSYTIVPYRIYFKNGLVKVEIALAKGKNLHDKRQVDRARQMDREIQKSIKNRF